MKDHHTPHWHDATWTAKDGWALPGIEQHAAPLIVLAPAGGWNWPFRIFNLKSNSPKIGMSKEQN